MCCFYHSKTSLFRMAWLNGKLSNVLCFVDAITSDMCVPEA